MVGLKLSLIFVAVLFIDGLILPAIFGFRESFLSILFLIVPILYLGPTREALIYGVIFALVLEAVRGLGIGDAVIPFLLAAVAIFLTQKLLDIRYTYDTRFSLSRAVLVALVSVVFIYAMNIDYLDVFMGLIVAVQALALVFTLNFVFNKKNDYVS